MQLHPWIISSWPIIELPVQCAEALSTKLHHLGTVVSDDCDEYGRLLGHSIWSALDERIGLAWEWIETLDGVFALADPMTVLSNIAFVRTDGSSLADTSVTVQLNRITHSLPWQEDVVQATRMRRMATPWSARTTTLTAEDYHFVASSFSETAWAT